MYPAGYYKYTYGDVLAAGWTVTLDSDAHTIDWTAPAGIKVFYVWVKQSNSGTMFGYKAGATSDTALPVPGAGGGLSHVSFFYTTYVPTATPTPTLPVSTPTPTLPVSTPTPTLPVSTPTPTLPVSTPTPTPQITIPENTPPLTTITSEATVTEPPLPKTGGVDTNLLYLLGSALVAGGLMLKRRRSER